MHLWKQMVAVTIFSTVCAVASAEPEDMSAPRPHKHIAVALYEGPGASERGARRLAGAIDQAPDMELERLAPDDIRPSVLQRFDVIVFPGGSGSKQAKAVGPTGRDHVRAFVREGGGCLGVCAGAYLCSAHYSWSLDLVDTSVFTGAREIEGLGKKQMWYRGESSKVTMQLTEEGRKLFRAVPDRVEVVYQNGPIVSPKEHPNLSPYTPLAYFRSEKALYEPQRGTMIDTPAIVSGHFHQGRVIAVSPHPEATKALYSIITESIRWVAGRIQPAPEEGSQTTGSRPATVRRLAISSGKRAFTLCLPIGL